MRVEPSISLVVEDMSTFAGLISSGFSPALGGGVGDWFEVAVVATETWCTSSAACAIASRGSLVEVVLGMYHVGCAATASSVPEWEYSID